MCEMNKWKHFKWSPSVDPKNLKPYEVYSFAGDNLTLEIDKKDRSPFPYKKGPLSLDSGEKKKRETIGLPHQRVGCPNDP